MGRYYYTNNNDFDGKFWFGVQSSDDPERVYGMKPSASYSESEVDFDADEQDNERIMTELDRQFSLLGVPKNERRYRFDSANEIGAYVWDDLRDKFLTKKPTRDRAGRPNIPYGFGDSAKDHMWPRSPEKVLAAARVDLGLRILNDIRIHGACHMTAEL